MRKKEDIDEEATGQKYCKATGFIFFGTFWILKLTVACCWPCAASFVESCIYHFACLVSSDPSVCLPACYIAAACLLCYGRPIESTIGKNLLSSNTSCTCPDNMVNFGPLTAEIGSGVWGTPTNFNGFCVLAALLHGI